MRLKTDGTSIVGAVSMADDRAVEIFDGRIDGNTILFKAKSPNGDRTIVFTGRVEADTIAFTRDVQVREGNRSCTVRPPTCMPMTRFPLHLRDCVAADVGMGPSSA